MDMLAQQILAMQEELEEVIVPSERTTFSKKKAHFWFRVRQM